MQQIMRGKKYQNGIQVIWTIAGKESENFFSYGELIDMKINVLDVLNNPHLYRVDTGNHRIQSAV